MSTQVTITLPDDVYRRAKNVAQVTKRDLGEVLANAVALTLPSSDHDDAPGWSPADLSDDEVVALSELQPPPDQERRFSELLDKQQSGTLAPSERGELLVFMRVYQHGTLLKAEALAEAVRRGLRPPLDS
jgi:hypothetical protein